MKRKITLIVLCLLSVAISVSAQEMRKYEIGADVSYGISLAKSNSNHVGVNVFGGYKPTEHITIGAGINYSCFQNRLLPYDNEFVFIQTEPYHSFRPYVYGRYDFLPSCKWIPFVGARVGYGFFSKSTFIFGVLPPSGSMYGEDDLSAYEYLKDLDHTLGVKGGVFCAMNFGISRKIGQKGSRITLGASLEIQPMTFKYVDKSEYRTGITIGPNIGFSF